MRRALYLDERPELVDLEPGFVLRLVAEHVRHVGEVVADAEAHRHRDLLAAPRSVAPDARRRPHDDRQYDHRRPADRLHLRDKIQPLDSLQFSVEFCACAF